MGEDLAISILAAAEAAHFFSAFNPSIFTIKRFPDEQTIKDISIGCTLASIFGVIIAAATSYLAKSWKPLLFCISMIAAMDAIYIFTATSAKNKTQ